MGSTSGAIRSLLIGVCLLTAANALLGTLISVRMSLEDFARLFSGLVMSAYYGGFVIGTLVARRIIDRVGYSRAFTAFAATAGVAASAHALFISPIPWILFRAAVGFAIAGQLVVAESWLNSTAQPENRARVFALYMIAVYFAFGSGQFALVLGNPAGVQLFLIVLLLLSASIIPMALTRATAPHTPASPRLRIRHIYDAAPLGLVGAVMAGLAVGSVQAIGPQFAREIGLSIVRISWFMGAFFLSGLLLQWPAGYLSDRTDRRFVLAGMAAITLLVFVAIALTRGGSFATLIALAVAGGGAVATLYPLSVAHANDRLRGQSVIAISATLLLANGLGAASGPVLATSMMLWLGAEGLFYFAAAPCAILIALAAWRIIRHAPVEQDRWQPAAQTTPAVLELDPRAQV